jgi:hypothetical protein
MRRFLLPATALVLVVTACGAGAKPAPRLAEAAVRQPTVRALRGGTIIRVDADVRWIHPRSPQEHVPSRTSEIVVTSPAGTARVTDRAEVTRIVRWFDALPVAQAGGTVVCPAEFPQDGIALSFRGRGGAWLAEADVPPSRANICNAIVFHIGRKARRPLIDRDAGESFVRRLGRLLGHSNG